MGDCVSVKFIVFQQQGATIPNGLFKKSRWGDQENKFSSSPGTAFIAGWLPRLHPITASTGKIACDVFPLNVPGKKNSP